MPPYYDACRYETQIPNNGLLSGATRLLNRRARRPSVVGDAVTKMAGRMGIPPVTCWRLASALRREIWRVARSPLRHRLAVTSGGHPVRYQAHLSNRPSYVRKGQGQGPQSLGIELARHHDPFSAMYNLLSPQDSASRRKTILTPCCSDSLVNEP